MERVVDVVPNLVRGHKSNGRCKYDRSAKAALVQRCLQPGVSLAATALAHGVNANLLRKWVVEYARNRGISLPRRRSMKATLLPVVPTSEAPAPTPSKPMLAQDPPGQLEVCIAGASVRITGPVDMQQLRCVLDCLALRR